jgi:rhodanese-related sulfurtransferase
MKKLLIIMALFGSLFSAKAQESAHIKVLDAETFKTAIKSKNTQLIDVRTSNEYDYGHIENAVNVDFFERDKFITYFKTLDKSKPIYLYCRSGSRSRSASKTLEDLGFKEIYDLKGGILRYK